MIARKRERERERIDYFQIVRVDLEEAENNHNNK